MNNNIYKNILKKSPFGFAYHKVVTDKSGEVVDYIFLETNPAFEELTGLKSSDIIGKKVSEVIPTIKDDKEFDWIKFYGEVAISGIDKDFEQYSNALDKWYKVQAFSFEKYYFATVFLDFTHNKESEIQIFNQKQQFELAVSGSRDGIWDWNLINNEVYFSPRWKEQLGYEENEIESSYGLFESLLHPDDLKRVKRNIDSYLKGTLKVYDLEFRMKHKDGSYRWINAKGKVLKDSKGIPYRMSGSHTDITEKKKLEEKILEEKENQKTILNGLPGVYIQLFDRNMNLIFYNDEMKKRYNITEENGYRACYEYILESDKPCENCITKKAIETKQIQEKEIVDSKGNIYKVKSTPILDSNGDVSQVVHMWIDITEEKHFAEKLQKSEERKALLIKSMNDMIVILDNDFVFMEYYMSQNNKVVISPEIFMGKSFIDIDFPKPAYWIIKEALINTRKTHKIQEVEYYLDEDGNRYWYNLQVTPLKDNKGEHTGLTCIIRNITKQRKAEEELLKEHELFSQGPVFIIIWKPNEEWSIKYISDNSEKILGYSIEEITDEKFSYASIIHPDDKERIRRETEKRIKNKKEFYEQSYRLRMKNGEYRWFYDFTMLSLNENKDVTEIRGYLYDQTHQKEMEFRLIEERKRLDEIIKGTNIGTWEWNVQSGVTLFNERWAEMIGYTLKELSPTTIETWNSIVHKEDGERSAKLLKEHFEGKRPYYECEVRMKHRDGHWIWVLDRGRVSEWTIDKKPIWVFGTHQDITERKLYEEKLRNSKIMLETVMNSIPQFIFWKDVNSVYLGCNENGRRLANLEKAEDIIGKTDYDLPWRNTDADDFIKEDQRVIESGIGSNHSVEFRMYNNEETWIDKNKIPLFDSNGEKSGILITFEDISERIQTERNLKISEKRYRGLIESQNDLIMRVDIDGKFTFVNDVYCKTFGKNKEELIGNYFSPDIHKEDIEDTSKKIEALNKPPYRAYIVQRVNTINGWRWLAWEDSAIKDDKGDIVEIQGVGRDITDLKETQLKAEEASKAKSEFLANMSHEIRTPLNSVIGFSELLLDIEDIKPQYKSYVRYINKAADSLLEVINDILDMSKIEAGKLELSYSQVDLIEILEEIMDIIKINIAKKDIELLLNIENELPKLIEIDPIRLKQVLLNLLGNSTKFTENGEIELKIKFESKNENTALIYFEVRDTGIGIPKENEERLFKAFSQGDTSITRKFGGTGLGLVISSMLIEKMGGKLSLKSQEGKGSKFYFEIEVKYSNIREKQYNLSEDIKNALIIDDNYNNRVILKQYLEKWGIKSKSVASGEEAVALCQTSEEFDLFIIDYNMPNMNGIEVINNLERIGSHIVLLYSSEEDSIQHPKIDLKLSKPVKEKDLYNFLVMAAKKHGKKEEAKTFKKEKLEGSNQTIMVVEDIKMNRMLVKEIIDRLIINYKLIEASNGQEAVEYFEKYRPVMIFMDIQMPVMDGYTATKLIRNIDKNVPIIALTAGAIKEEKEKSFEIGVSDFITKPIQKDTFEKVFKKWFNYEGKINENIKEYYNEVSAVNSNNQFEAALLNVDKDIKLYTRIAEEYMNESAKLLNEINPAYEQNNKEHLYYIIHSIKGMASNVGLSQLAKLSADLLKELNYGNVISPERISLFEIKVHNSINSLEIFVNNLNVEKTGEKQMDTENILSFISSVKKLLENSDFIDDNILEALESGKSDIDEVNNQIGLLIKAIKEYNYENALSIIDGIENTIKDKGGAYEEKD